MPPEDVVLLGEGGRYFIKACSACLLPQESSHKKPTKGGGGGEGRSAVGGDGGAAFKKPSKRWGRASGLGRGKEASRAGCWIPRDEKLFSKGICFSLL